MINRCILVGRLTREPEARKGQSGVTITRFTIAIDRIAKQGQEKQADFINCVCFGNTAEFVEKYIKKGYLVGVDGRIQTGSYEDNTGKRIYTTEIVADTVQNYEPRANTPKTDNSTKMDQIEPQTKNDEFIPTLDIADDDLPF